MSFKEFDLTEYIEALEHFKTSNREDIVKNWGSLENFDLFIQKVRDDESNAAKLAIHEFGSIEKYTEAMKYNLEHFSEIMEKQLSDLTKNQLQQSTDLYRDLTSNMDKDASSAETQKKVQEIVTFIQDNATTTLGQSYWDMLIDIYASNEYEKAITDTKYGAGASDYIANALRCYFNK